MSMDFTGVEPLAPAALCTTAWLPAAAGGKKAATKKAADTKSADKKPDILEDTLKCVICFNLCERPVTVSTRM